MPFTTLSLGLTLTIPTNGSRNWGTTLFSTTWTKISNHNHTGSGDGNQMVTGSYSTGSITNVKIADSNITLIKMAKNAGFFVYPTVLLPLLTTQTIDWSNGSFQVLDLGSATGNVTLTLNNPLSGGLYRIKAIQAASPLDIIYPASVIWPQGQKPILSQVNDAIDLIELFYDGTNYYGSWDLSYS